MRFLISFTAGVVVVLTIIACNSAPRNATAERSSSSVSPEPATNGKVSPATAPNDGVRRITTVEAQDLLAKGEAVVIDVRNEASFKAGHIRGAKLIPAGDILAHINELPKNKLIVTYCS